jgi:endonuclease/exonuclease/phosphatase family metal-dependent hydrolase
MSQEEERGSELVPGVAYRDLVEAAMRHRTERSFHNSDFYRAHGAALESLLLTPRLETPATPPEPFGLRVLHWNIEKGKELGGVIRQLREDSWMQRADLILLNEVDCGTARGGNGDQARLLSEALGMHHVWLPTFIECTKGVGSDLSAPGENRLGLHGLAVLSRWPILSARAAVLPPCHDYFEFHEKRVGGRRGLYTLIEAGGCRVVVATTHLEVRNTPRCRARQFDAFLRGLEAALTAWGTRRTPVILGGDWNTNSFRRGSFGAAAAEFLRLVTTPAAVLDRELAQPIAREPLFALLSEAGFELASCNEATPTAEQVLGTVEDLSLLPAPLARGINRAFRLSGRVLRMRLDWIAVRGLEACDRPVTISATGPNGRPVSDHAAIGVDLRSR